MSRQIFGIICYVPDQPFQTPAIAEYARFLKARYHTCPIATVVSWPPTPSKEYIQLAVIKQNRKINEKYIGHTLKGNIQEILEDREIITTDKILDKQEPLFVIIEGAPGMGKSTLAWELCRKWEEFPHMKKYSLVILLRLRETGVQKMTCLSEIFPRNHIDTITLLRDIYQCLGEGVLFVLDGFDELPLTLQQNGFFVDLMNKNIFPKCSIVVTTRSSASGTLLTYVNNSLVSSHLEILGFTQQNVKNYAQSVFSSDSEMLSDFETATSSLKNPAINSLMYVPINAAIIVQIFKENNKLPLTLTELYTEICLSIYNNHCLKHNKSKVRKLKDIPTEHCKHFDDLAKLAFENFEKEQLIFDTVPSDLDHFGFLNEMSSLYGGEEKSFNFLHLTIQEFLAAYHIAHLPDQGVELFKSYSKRWDIVWRFVAGMAQFSFLGTYQAESPFRNENEWLTPLFIECLFESQKVIDFQSIFNNNTQYCRIFSIIESSFYHFEVGGCIAKCSSAQSFWNLNFIALGKNKFDFFIKGLLMGTGHNYGVIKSIRIAYGRGAADFLSTLLDYQQKGVTLLNEVTHFGILNFIGVGQFPLKLLFVIPLLSNLKKLSLCSHFMGFSNNAKLYFDLFELLQHTAVQSLDVCGCGVETLLFQTPEVFSSFKALIHPSTGKLRELCIGSNMPVANEREIDDLVKIVSSCSSLQMLSIKYPHYLSCLANFESNNQITTLELKVMEIVLTLPPMHSTQNESCLLRSIVNILSHSKSLRHLIIVNAPIDACILSDKQIISTLKCCALETLQFHTIIYLGIFEAFHTWKNHVLHLSEDIKCEVTCKGDYYFDEKYLSKSNLPSLE